MKCGLLVMFLSGVLDSHSDGTHSLQKIHWWASDVMLNFSKYFPIKKQTHLLLGLRMITSSELSYFGVNYSFNSSILNIITFICYNCPQLLCMSQSTPQHSVFFNNIVFLKVNNSQNTFELLWILVIFLSNVLFTNWKQITQTTCNTTH